MDWVSLRLVSFDMIPSSIFTLARRSFVAAMTIYSQQCLRRYLFALLDPELGRRT
jgi:hypothetical protein